MTVLVLIVHLVTVLVFPVAGKSTIHKVSPATLFDQKSPTSPPDFIADQGYPVEVHEVETPDGYLLELHRIPGPPGSQDYPQRGEPFILQHGMAMNSICYTWFKDKSLSYYLADNGFDVWLSNVRGTRWGRRHTALTEADEQYWDFSWHEHGVLDMPAIVDYVLSRTGYSQVWYAGHSMGTTMMFVMQSERPEYSAKIKHFIALSPIAYMGHMTSVVKNFCSVDKLEQLRKLLRAAGIVNFPLDGPAGATVRSMVCTLFPGEVCSNLVSGLFNRNKDQEFEGSADLIAQYFPADMSIRQVLHYGQHCASLPNRFKKYNFDPDKNQELYGSPDAPDYNMDNVRAPMTWIYAINDNLGPPEDVEEFATRFPHNPPKMHKIPLESFNHVDFLNARDQRTYVGEPLLLAVLQHRQLTGPIPYSEAAKIESNAMVNTVSSGYQVSASSPESGVDVRKH